MPANKFDSAAPARGAAMDAAFDEMPREAPDTLRAIPNRANVPIFATAAVPRLKSERKHQAPGSQR